MIRRGVAIVVLVVACWGAAGVAQELTLARRLPAGRYVLTADTARYQVLTVNNVPKPPLGTKTKLTLAMHVHAAGPQDNALLELSFRTIAHSIRTRNKKVSYDSTAGGSPASRLGELLGPLLKAKVRLLLTPAGRVAAIKGLDAVWDARALKDPDLAKWVNQLKAEMGNEMVGDLVDQIGRVLPGRPVQVGGSWDGELRFRLPYVGERKQTQKVVLKTTAKQGQKLFAILDLRQTSNEPTASVVQVEPMPLTVRRVQMTQTGALHAALTTVWPVYLKLKRDSILTMSGNHPTQGRVAVQLKHALTMTLTIRPDTQAEPEAR